MPSHRVHREVCRLLGYDVWLCDCVNKAVDELPVHDVGRKPVDILLVPGISVGFPPWTTLVQYLPGRCPGDLDVLLELAFIHHLADRICQSWYEAGEGGEYFYVKDHAERLVQDIETWEARLGGFTSPRDVWNRVRERVLKRARKFYEAVMKDESCVKRKSKLTAFFKLLERCVKRGYWRVNGQILPSWAPVHSKVKAALEKGERVVVEVGGCRIEAGRLEDFILGAFNCLGGVIAECREAFLKSLENLLGRSPGEIEDEEFKRVVNEEFKEVLFSALAKVANDELNCGQVKEHCGRICDWLMGRLPLGDVMQRDDVCVIYAPVGVQIPLLEALKKWGTKVEIITLKTRY